MESSQGPSFIPKQPASGKVKRRGVRKVYIFTYVTFVLFFGVLIASGATFFYQISVEAQLQAKKEELIQQKEAFSEADIVRIKELDQKLNAAQSLLNNHISVISFLTALQNSTLEDVSFESFSLVREDEATILVELPAKTQDFNSVLFQKSVVDANPTLQGAEILDLHGESILKSLGFEGVSSGVFGEEITVNFLFKKSLKPSDIRYQPRGYTESRQPVVNSNEEETQVIDNVDVNLTEE